MTLNDNFDKFIEENKINFHLGEVNGTLYVYLENYETKDVTNTYFPLRMNNENYGLQTSMNTDEGMKYVAKEIMNTIYYQTARQNIYDIKGVSEALRKKIIKEK